MLHVDIIVSHVNIKCCMLTSCILHVDIIYHASRVQKFHVNTFRYGAYIPGPITIDACIPLLDNNRLFEIFLSVCGELLRLA